MVQRGNTPRARTDKGKGCKRMITEDKEGHKAGGC